MEKKGRLDELRERREAAVAAEEARRKREAERLAYFAAQERAGAVTEVEPPLRNKPGTVTKGVDTVTKVVEGKSSLKSGKIGRPSLLGTAMTDAERMRRYRAKRRMEKKAGGG